MWSATRVAPSRSASEGLAVFAARDDGLVVVRPLVCEKLVAGERMIVAIKRAVVRFKIDSPVEPALVVDVAAAKLFSVRPASQAQPAAN